MGDSALILRLLRNQKTYKQACMVRSSCRKTNATHHKRKLARYIEKHPGRHETIKEKRELLVTEPYHPSLRNHKLTGKLSGLRAIVIEYDCRIVFEPLKSDEILLINIGGHDDVY